MEREGQAQQGRRLCTLNSMKKHNFMNDFFVSRINKKETQWNPYILCQPHPCNATSHSCTSNDQLYITIFECKGHDIILYAYIWLYRKYIRIVWNLHMQDVCNIRYIVPSQCMCASASNRSKTYTCDTVTEYTHIMWKVCVCVCVLCNLPRAFNDSSVTVTVGYVLNTTHASWIEKKKHLRSRSCIHIKF